jgi:hypothetical protein
MMRPPQVSDAAALSAPVIEHLFPAKRINTFYLALPLM